MSGWNNCMQGFYDTIKDTTGQKVFDVEYRFQTKNNGLRRIRMAGEIVRRGGKSEFSEEL